MSAPIDRWGDFELIRHLAFGGMADLYLARSPRYPSELVVKCLQPRYLDVPQVVEMFIDEGRIALALRHAHIVKVFEVGQAGGSYFIAMEYIPGPDLLTICRRGLEVGHFLPRHLAVALLAQAALGLVYLHEKADESGRPMCIVHCDLSPGNLVVSSGGTAKIIDLGVARATDQRRSDGQHVAGKYSYMAPEQIRGQAIDARADLFAFGVVLYEMTVGKRLFPGRPEQVMRLVLDEPISRPSEIRSSYPEDLEQVVMRTLERDPARRTPSARALYSSLQTWLERNGEPHGKREIATYLRQVFSAPRQPDAEGEFGASNEAFASEWAGPKADALGETPLAVDEEDPPSGIHVSASAPTENLP